MIETIVKSTGADELRVCSTLLYIASLQFDLLPSSGTCTPISLWRLVFSRPLFMQLISSERRLDLTNSSYFLLRTFKKNGLPVTPLEFPPSPRVASMS